MKHTSMVLKRCRNTRHRRNWWWKLIGAFNRTLGAHKKNTNSSNMLIICATFYSTQINKYPNQISPKPNLWSIFKKNNLLKLINRIRTFTILKTSVFNGWKWKTFHQIPLASYQKSKYIPLHANRKKRTNESTINF